MCVCVLLYLCGGPAVDAGSSPAGEQPVSHSEEAGLRSQDRRGLVQAERHAVVAPCQRWRAARVKPHAVTHAEIKRGTSVLPGRARFHSGTSCSSSGRRDIQSGCPPSCSRSSSSIFFTGNILPRVYCCRCQSSTCSFFPCFEVKTPFVYEDFRVWNSCARLWRACTSGDRLQNKTGWLTRREVRFRNKSSCHRIITISI